MCQFITQGLTLQPDRRTPRISVMSAIPVITYNCTYACYPFTTTVNQGEKGKSIQPGIDCTTVVRIYNCAGN